MNHSAIDDLLHEHQDKVNLVQITRRISETETENCHGYIIGYSKDLVLMQRCEDFYIDGFEIFRIDSIENIRFNRKDKYFDKIMRWEGELKNIKTNIKMDLSDWASTFTSLKKDKKIAIIECEDPSDSSFDIGPVLKVGKRSVYIQYFDATGLIDEELSAISFDHITKVTFDNKYINIFSKYIRKRRKSPVANK